MKLYHVLYSASAVLAFAAWVVQQRDDSTRSEQDKVEARKTKDDIVARISERTVPLSDLSSIRKELAHRGFDHASETSFPTEVQQESASAAIDEAVRKIAPQVRADQHAEVEALREEMKAQSLASSIDREFRPQIEAVLKVIEQTISEASAGNLIALKEKTKLLTLPPRIAYTTFEMKENGIQEEQPERFMRFDFEGGASWTVFWKTGMVRSPALLARPWDAPTDKYYPMLRIRHIRGNRTLELGTIWFHQDSKELGLVLNARNELSEQDRAAFDSIDRSYSGTTRIQRLLVELLKDVRVNHF